MFSLKEIIRTYQSLDYKFFNFDRSFNVNVGSIRTNCMKVNEFNDYIYLIFSDRGIIKFHLWEGTADPGLYWLKNPYKVKGTALLAPNQYLGTHKLDLHNNKYLALCQRLGKVKVYRDFNKDDQYDYDESTAEWGMFGINWHRASRWKDLFRIGKTSAGCQVTRSYFNFKTFIKYLKISAKIYGNKFSVTVLTENQIRNANKINI